ncbi:MAG: mechanosensitive ion channel [Candidatus Gracilibacteria bacterium]|nr:mechanosensitive ion channel [Candidatus Gracilibacteria bacterium]
MLEFINEHINIVLIILIIIGYSIIEFILKNSIKQIKNIINKKYSEEELDNIENIDSLDQDLYIEYYKRKNIIKFIRFAIVFSIICSIILFKIPGVFSFLAIAIGAIIITFKEVILSFFGFFYVSAHFKIGENIQLGDQNNGIRGEIIYTNIINVGIIGKSENGEHNGQFYTIPNYKLVIENVKREELSIGKYRREEFEIPFKKDLFKINYNEFLEKLREFLDENLVKKNINNVGNYKTYIGYKYKLKFKYDKEYLMINISIIEKQREILEIQSKIVNFVESYKKESIK